MSHLTRRSLLQAACVVPAFTPFMAWASETLPAQQSLRDKFLARATFGSTKALRSKGNGGSTSGWINDLLTQEGPLDPFALEVRALFPLIASPPVVMHAVTSYTFGIGTNLYRPAFINATWYRRIFSPHQLHERMVEMWNDHFSTDINKMPNDTSVIKLAFDEEAIRPNALKSFPALLKATTRHPGMLFYLDQQLNGKNSLNENYARELLELHTMGVDGGYTESDMVALTRILSGWTFKNLPTDELLATLTEGQPLSPSLYFDPTQHDTGEKTFLGHYFPPGGGAGEKDRAIALILSQPAVSRHVARRICRHFVSDNPRAETIEAVASTYLSTNGHIPAMLKTAFDSAEFRDLSNIKIRRPQDFLVAAYRAAQVSRTTALMEVANINDWSADVLAEPANLIHLDILTEYAGRAGHALFEHPAPDGYPDYAEYWLSPNALNHQWRFTNDIVKHVDYLAWLKNPGTIPLALGGNLWNLINRPSAVSNGQTTPRTITEALWGNLFGGAPSSNLTLMLTQNFLDTTNVDRTLGEGGRKQFAERTLAALLSSPYMLVK